MADRERITLTLPADVLRAVRKLSGGNLSRWVTSVIQRDLERRQREELRLALERGYALEADLDLEMCEEFRHVDREAAALPEEQP